MAVHQKSAYCKLCKQQTLHLRHTMGSGWGCFLTLLTGGLFAPIWFLSELSGRWHCQRCGAKKRESFRLD